MKSLILALGAVVALAALAPAAPAWAQSGGQCRAKCTDEEQACLKRTGNKGQCGDKAKQCLDKCK